MSFDAVDAAHKANFVAFAYNMYGSGSNLTPPPDPGIDAAGYQLVLYLNAHDFETVKFYGYIAASKSNPGNLILVVRGTEDPAEWLLDFAALPVPFGPVPAAGFVALGFLSIFQTFAFLDTSGAAVGTLSQAIAHLNSLSPIASLAVIGHSLGAALATLAAAELALLNPAGVQSKLTIWTFGSPRVGLLDFAASFDKAVKNSYRVWNTLDIVPEIPTFPFIHVSGLGDRIVQTQQQLQSLLITPACEHHLTTYEWLLDAADFPLDSDCRVPAAAAVAAEAAAVRAVGAHEVFVEGEAAAVVTANPHELGAQMLYAAMYGHS